MEPTIKIRAALIVMPVQTLRILRDESTGIIRRWRPGDAERCQLCRICTVQVGEDGMSVCYKEAAGVISEKSAASFAFD